MIQHLKFTYLLRAEVSGMARLNSILWVDKNFMVNATSSFRQEALSSDGTGSHVKVLVRIN